VTGAAFRRSADGVTALAARRLPTECGSRQQNGNAVIPVGLYPRLFESPQNRRMVPNEQCRVRHFLRRRSTGGEAPGGDLYATVPESNFRVSTIAAGRYCGERGWRFPPEFSAVGAMLFQAVLDGVLSGREVGPEVWGRDGFPTGLYAGLDLTVPESTVQESNFRSWGGVRGTRIPRRGSAVAERQLSPALSAPSAGRLSLPAAADRSALPRDRQGADLAKCAGGV